MCSKDVPAPRIHQTNWQAGDSFAEEDDPDRVLIPWKPAAFLLPGIGGVGKLDPVEAMRLRAGRTTHAEELDLLGRTPTSFAKLVHNVFSSEECAQLLTSANEKGFTPALLNYGGGRQVREHNTSSK
eukprot:scaffold469463_cov42-Prasinocladus_malaysianus.AAC.1